MVCNDLGPPGLLHPRHLRERIAVTIQRGNSAVLLTWARKCFPAVHTWRAWRAGWQVAAARGQAAALVALVPPLGRAASKAVRQ